MAPFLRVRANSPLPGLRMEFQWCCRQIAASVRLRSFQWVQGFQRGLDEKEKVQPSTVEINAHRGTIRTKDRECEDGESIAQEPSTVGSASNWCFDALKSRTLRRSTDKSAETRGADLEASCRTAREECCGALAFIPGAARAFAAQPRSRVCRSGYQASACRRGLRRSDGSAPNRSPNPRAWW